MTRVKLDQTGVGHLVALLIVLVIAAAGFGGYRVLQATNDTQSNAPEAAQEVADKYESKHDLQQGAKELDAEQVDKNVDPSQLDEDLSEL